MDFWQDQPLMANRLDEVHRRMLSLVPSTGRFAGIIGDLARNRGKMLRPALLILSAGLDQRRPEADRLASALEFLHLASLVHDDIIDDATMRRGAPSVVSRHGLAMALYTGDYLIYLAARSLTGLEPALLQDGSLDFMSTILEAEAGQLEARYATDLTRETYLDRIEAKTGLLFSLAARMGSHLTGQTGHVQAMGQAGLDFGAAFQLRDDLLDLADPEGPDLKEGNYTLPVLLALQENPALKTWLTPEQGSLRDFAPIIAHVLASRGPEQSRAILDDYLDRASRVFQANLGTAEYGIFQWMSKTLFGGHDENNSPSKNQPQSGCHR